MRRSGARSRTAPSHGGRRARLETARAHLAERRARRSLPYFCSDLRNGVERRMSGDRVEVRVAMEQSGVRPHGDRRDQAVREPPDRRPLPAARAIEACGRFVVGRLLEREKAAAVEQPAQVARVSLVDRSGEQLEHDEPGRRERLVLVDRLVTRRSAGLPVARRYSIHAELSTRITTSARSRPAARPGRPPSPGRAARAPLRGSSAPCRGDEARDRPLRASSAARSGA